MDTGAVAAVFVKCSPGKLGSCLLIAQFLNVLLVILDFCTIFLTSRFVVIPGRLAMGLANMRVL
jgi:hypothetical protein